MTNSDGQATVTFHAENKTTTVSPKSATAQQTSSSDGCTYYQMDWNLVGEGVPPGAELKFHAISPNDSTDFHDLDSAATNEAGTAWRWTWWTPNHRNPLDDAYTITILYEGQVHSNPPPPPQANPEATQEEGIVGDGFYSDDPTLILPPTEPDHG